MKTQTHIKGLTDEQFILLIKEFGILFTRQEVIDNFHINKGRFDALVDSGVLKALKLGEMKTHVFGIKNIFSIEDILIRDQDDISELIK